MRRRLALIVAVAVIAAVPVSSLGTAAETIRANVRPAWNDDAVLTVLLVGSDIGPPHRTGNPLEGNADALHVVAVDTRRKAATIVDIPRDAHIGGTKVNAHLSFGGPSRLRRVLEDYSGLDIDYYAVTSFAGLERLVDTLGGVRITLDAPIKDAAAKADLRGGRQRLSGEQALAFTRARKTLPDGDFDRTRHQGDLLRAVHAQLRSSGADLRTLTELVAAFSRNTESDMPPGQLLRIGALALEVAPSRVRQVSLSGAFDLSDGQSIVYLNAGDAFSDIEAGRIGP